MILWAAGFFVSCLLFFVLIYKRRYRLVPWFTLWIAVGILTNLTGFLAFRYGSKDIYAAIYWTSDFIDAALQIAVVLEIARYVLGRSGRWIEGSNLRLVAMGITAPIVAGLMAALMHPAAATVRDAWLARASLFTTVLISLMFTAVLLTSQQLGLGLRNHVMRESYGLMVWTLVAFTTDTLHAYWRTMGQFTALEDIRIVVFQGTVLYWAIIFWLPERTVAPPSPVVIKELQDLISRLDYPQSSEHHRR